MYWLFLLLAIGAFMLAISTPQMWLLVLSLLASLGFFLLWIRGLYVAKIGGVLPDAPRSLHPAEVQRLREQLRPAAPAEEAAAPPPAPRNEP
ncbi:hypothetical protein OK348_11175 [Flavobacterium sp. MXW15]|uniref:Uncharacterized protein n=1 Tax=Xanthomonas chitinilytica TaxID=2989819 RepID=A0ABT3JY75_9XANT|nr:hypothetical protein [Xanthomonas sp. H13-6]MCW4455352.1 hypothetical protein [Flavobacterium sp. MXW15]MCW4473179.1 hypothetical protein [Xanthomonas sp. H13-6]